MSSQLTIECDFYSTEGAYNEDVLTTFSVASELLEDDTGSLYPTYTATLLSIKLGCTALPVSMVRAIYGDKAVDAAEQRAEDYAHEHW